jgi:hypothetical protein
LAADARLYLSADARLYFSAYQRLHACILFRSSSNMTRDM